MSKVQKLASKPVGQVIEVKSKFDAEFRRFSLPRPSDEEVLRFSDFYRLLESLHGLRASPFIICYTDQYGDLLPINNDDNYQRALHSARPMLRLLVQHQGESYGEMNGYGPIPRKQNPLLSRLKTGSATPPEPTAARPHLAISMPKDFRQVSSIIDVDIVPETHRRVKLIKNSSDKPLGFYIRDGQSVRATPHGVEKVPAIFISRLVPGGLAESTGLLAVSDEVLEVNGIEVAGKTLDQVTDMMVANSANLIITVKPVNQRNTLPRRGITTRSSGTSQGSQGSAKMSLGGGSAGAAADDDEDDEVRDYTAQHSLLGLSGQGSAMR